MSLFFHVLGPHFAPTKHEGCAAHFAEQAYPFFGLVARGLHFIDGMKIPKKTLHDRASNVALHICLEPLSHATMICSSIMAQHAVQAKTLRLQHQRIKMLLGNLDNKKK